MKRPAAIICAMILIICALPICSAGAASSDFTLEDGVVLSYNGGDTDIFVPDGAYSIADEAFCNNTSITSITLPPGLSRIGNNAFSGCTSLKAVYGGQDVSYVGAFAFSDTPYLMQSTDEMLILGRTLIWYNGSAESVNLPDYVFCVAPYAFLRDNTLKSFKANYLNAVGEGAFYECANLTNVNINTSLSYVGAYAFYGTPFLAARGDYPIIGDGILIGCNSSAQHVTLPQNVRRIAPRAFADNKTLVSVKLPSTVYAVEKQAFMNCTSLLTVEFSSGLYSIGEEAFAGCTALSAVEMPISLRHIGKGAFLNCAGMTGACIAGDGLIVSDAAFAGCTALEWVLIGDSVNSIGDYVFMNDTSLTAVSIPDTLTVIGVTSFDGCGDFSIVCERQSFAANAFRSRAQMIYLRGDTDLDGIVTILDATRIQRSVAMMASLDAQMTARADVDCDGYITVLDATRIQRIIARLD